MIRSTLFVAALSAVVASLAAAQPLPVAPPSPVAAAAPDAVFPAGAGRDTFLRLCSGCHSPAVAAQQRLTPAGWSSIVEQMAGNGAPGTDAELDAVKAYLAASFPAGQAAAPSPGQR